MKIISIDSDSFINLDLVTEFTCKNTNKVSLKLFFGTQYVLLEVDHGANNPRANQLREIISKILTYFKENEL